MSRTGYPPLVLQSDGCDARGVLCELLGVAMLLPLGAAVIGSLGWSGAGGSYARWWGTLRGWETLWTTVRLGALAAVVAIVLAWALVAAAVRCSRRWAFVVAMLSCLPLLVPSSTLVTVWIILMSPQAMIGAALRNLGFTLYSTPAAAAILGMRYFGIAVAVLMSYRLRGPPARSASERVFRIPRVTAALRLHLPPALRVTAAGGLVVMLFCMNDHIIPGMLLISTYGPQVMIQYSALLDPGGAAALTVPIAAVGMGMMVLSLMVGRSAFPRTEDPPDRMSPSDSPACRVIAGTAVMIILALVLGAPIAILGCQAESWSAPVRALWDARAQLTETIYCVAVATPICVVVGGVLGSHWVRRRRAGRHTVVPLVLLNLTVPAALLGIGATELLLHSPLRAIRDSSIPLILAYVGRFAPLATLIFFAFWRNDSGCPSSLGDLAARVHGVGGWRRALWLVWPRRRALLISVAAVCAMLIATELEMSVLLSAPGRATLGIRLYTLIHTAPDSTISALTLGMLALTAPGIVVLVVLLSRFGPGTRRGKRYAS